MNSTVYNVIVLCLSVCLSVTLVYCVETTEFIIKQLALGTLVYGHQTRNIISLSIPLSGALIREGCKLTLMWFLSHHTRHKQNDYRTLTETCICPTHRYYFQWPWTTPNQDFKYTSVAQYLCDSWASCFSKLGAAQKIRYNPVKQSEIVHIMWQNNNILHSAYSSVNRERGYNMRMHFSI